MRPLFTLLASAVMLSSIGQVTITYADIDPNGVVSDMQAITDFGVAVPPSPGVDQTWDLSSISLLNIGTMTFGTAAGTPYAGTYPTANWTWAQNVTGLGTDYIYLDISSSAIGILARQVPSAPLNYSEASDVMRFPMAYNQSYTDPYVLNGSPSTITWTYTGHGTLILPNGTFNNVVMMESDEDDILLWNTTPLYPLVIDNSEDVYVFTQNNVGISKSEQTMTRLSPNPCHDVLKLDGVGLGANWQVLDGQGRVVASGRNSMSATTMQVDVRELVPGVYVLNVANGDSTSRTSFMKQ